jgi:hypothetical protein
MCSLGWCFGFYSHKHCKGVVGDRIPDALLLQLNLKKTNRDEDEALPKLLYNNILF